MAINYNGTGGLFVRLGKLFQLVKAIETFQGTCREEIDDVSDVFVGDVAALWQITPLTDSRESFAFPMSVQVEAISNICKTVLVEAVKDGLNLQPTSFVHALELLIKDMKSGSTKTIASGSSTNTIYVEANTISETVATTSIVSGGGTMIVANYMPMSKLATSVQKQNQGVFAEALRVECIQDESSGTDPGKELFHVTGKERKPTANQEWPLGSGTNITCSVMSAGATNRISNPYGNMLVNSGFDLWSSATEPIRWVADHSRASGSWSNGGTDSDADKMEQKNINFTPDGDYSLEFNGDGTEKHRVYQVFGAASGTLARVAPDSTYVFSCRLRSTSGTISSGVISASLANASYTSISTATTTLDFSSTNITDSAWVHVTGVWQTDTQDIGSDIRFVLQMTTALQNGKSLLIDELVLGKPHPLYAGGPAIAIVRGSADYLIENYFTLTIANNNSSEMQKYFRKLLDTEISGVSLPVAGGTEMADSLIG